MRTDFGGLQCKPDSNSLETRAPSAVVLMSHQELLSTFRSICFLRIGAPVPLTSRVLREDLAVCTGLESGFLASALCTFLHSEDPNHGPNVAAPQDLMDLLQERCRSFRFLSKAESATWNCSLSSRTSPTSSSLRGPNCGSSALFVITLS